ncbi:MAG: alpha/beta hydrolase [Eubacteriales bacterium]
MKKYAIAKEFRALRKLRVSIDSLEKIITIRKAEEALKHVIRKKKHGVTIEHMSIPGYQGEMIDVYVYNPEERKENTPYLLHFHGGAYISGNGYTNFLLPRYAHELGCPVFSVEYRLAPEFPFPFGQNDCFAVLEYLNKNAKELGLDATRAVVTGESAGGGLAASVCQMARDKGIPVALQVLLYPVISNACDTPSMKMFVDTPVWDYPSSVYMWEYYLPLKEGETPPKYAVPALGDLKGLAPCFIETAEFDPLRDEGLAYAKALKEAGVPTHLEETKGTIHGYDQSPIKGPITKRQIEIRIAAMAEAMAK